MDDHVELPAPVSRPPSPLFEWGLVVMPFIVGLPMVLGPGTVTVSMVLWSVLGFAGLAGLYLIDVPGWVARREGSAWWGPLPLALLGFMSAGLVWWLAGTIALSMTRPSFGAMAIALGPVPLAGCIHAGTIATRPLGDSALAGRGGGLVGFAVGLAASAALYTPYVLLVIYAMSVSA